MTIGGGLVRGAASLRFAITRSSEKGAATVADDRTLVPIRERPFLEVLDLALAVVRRRPLVLATAAVLGIAPWEAINVTIGLAWTGEGWFRAWAWLALVTLEAPLATAPITVVMGALMFGRRTGVREVLSSLGRGAVGLLFYQGFVRGVLLGTIALAFLVPSRFMFVNEVVLLERPRWSRVPARCGMLSRDRGAELVGVALLQLAFMALFAVAFSRAGNRAWELLFRDWTWDLQPEGGIVSRGIARLGVWGAVAFFAVGRFLLYIDQRIRLEGWEVAIRLRDAGAAMEGDERW